MGKKLVGAVVFAVLAASSVCAQDHATPKKAASQKVTGCLQQGQENQGFFIVSKGKHWELYSDSGVAFADSVGKKVTVTGSPAKRSADQEKDTQPTEKKEAGKMMHGDLQVTNLKVVADSCKK